MPNSLVVQHVGRDAALADFSFGNAEFAGDDGDDLRAAEAGLAPAHSRADTALHGVERSNCGLVSDTLICCGVRHPLSNYGADRDGEGTGGRNAECAEITLRARRRCG